MNQEKLKELQSEMQVLFKESFKYKFFNKYFNSIPEDEIYGYHLIVPLSFEDKLGESLNNLKEYNWIHITEYTDEIIAVKQDFLTGMMSELKEK